MKWRYIAWVAVLPIIGAILLSVLWVAIYAKSREDYAAARQAAFRQETVLASSYAAQLHQTINQIEQLTLNLKDDWENSPVPLSLERKRSRGLFPETSLVSATIIGSTGTILTSSLAGAAGINGGDLAFFRQLRNGCCDGLLISPPSVGRRVDRPVIRFSRRLNKPDGTFDGAVITSVAPSYLASFQEDGLSPGNFVSVRLTNGQFLASRRGSAEPGVEAIYRSDPHFPTPSGTAFEPGEKFRDNVPRFVAWHKLEGHPLVAVAGIVEPEALAPYKDIERGRRQMAMVASAFLVVFAGLATHLSYRLAWRRQLEDEVRVTYRLATDAANEGFYMIRPVYDREGTAVDFQVEDCNQRGAALYGMSREAFIGQKVSEFQSEQYRKEVFALFRRVLMCGIYEDELRVSPLSPLKAAWVHRRLVRSGEGLALTMRDVSEEKEHEQALTDLANSDALTKLPNRRWLSDFLPTAVRHAAKGNRHVAILFIDLDNFKDVNDTLGHAAGDELLQQSAQRLKHVVRASDHVVRLGGDEFTVVLENVDAVDDVARVARIIVASLAEPFKLHIGKENQVSASVGISVYPQDGTDGDSLLKHADIAMYAAKANGKGKYYFYQSHLSDALLLRLNKERMLRHAIAHDEFVVYFQPRVATDTGRFSSMEALVRWMHPDRGIVYPTEFIGLAEDLGLIVAIGELVVEKVFAQYAQWKAQGLDLVPVSINISPQQLKAGNISAFIAAQMARHDIDVSLVEVELTESAVIDKSETVSNELAGLRALGVRLLIDDFGTGYSSLAQLHRLDVDILKVDQEFTASVASDADATLLFRAIVSMADALGMSVVAEGVETPEQLSVLQSLSCDEIQGYLVSQALAASEIPPLLLKRFLFPSFERPEPTAAT